jgi:hypothetical protein
MMMGFEAVLETLGGVKVVGIVSVVDGAVIGDPLIPVSASLRHGSALMYLLPLKQIKP